MGCLCLTPWSIACHEQQKSDVAVPGARSPLCLQSFPYPQKHERGAVTDTKPHMKHCGGAPVWYSLEINSLLTYVVLRQSRMEKRGGGGDRARAVNQTCNPAWGKAANIHIDLCPKKVGGNLSSSIVHIDENSPTRWLVHPKPSLCSGYRLPTSETKTKTKTSAHSRSAILPLLHKMFSLDIGTMKSGGKSK